MSEKKFTILYVDDEEDNLITFKSFFRREYDVITAISGQEALKIVKETHIDLAISDQRMPSMSGVEFLSIMVREYPFVKRMILTGHSDTVDIIEAINSGKVEAYITKPWSKEELKNTISKALSEQSEILSLQKRVSELEDENLKLKKKLNNLKP